MIPLAEIAKTEINEIQQISPQEPILQTAISVGDTVGWNEFISACDAEGIILGCQEGREEGKMVGW